MVTGPALATGPRVELHHPTERARHDFLAATNASLELHHPWVAPPLDDEGFTAALVRAASDTTEAHLVHAREGHGLVGVVNINNIVRSSFLSGQLGWYTLAGGEGRGLMSEAVSLVVDRAFGPLGLHRLEANIQPGNTASVALARRLGFRLEGHSPRYLFMAGGWRDHDRYALTTEDRGR